MTDTSSIQKEGSAIVPPQLSRQGDARSDANSAATRSLVFLIGRGRRRMSFLKLNRRFHMDMIASILQMTYLRLTGRGSLSFAKRSGKESFFSNGSAWAELIQSIGIAIAMKNAGCDRIFFGIESGNDQVLKTMNKKITVEEARKAVNSAHTAGIRTGAFFILCYPGETNETVLDTIRFATSLPLDYLSFTVPYPLPGTALFERVKHKIKKDWTVPGGFFSDHVLIFDAEFSETKMKLAILKGQIQFGLRKRLGKYAFVVEIPFERLTDGIFRLIK